MRPRALEKFALTDTIRDHGFDRVETDVITSAHDEIASGLRSLAVAASLAAVAIDHPDEAAALAAQATQAASTGQSLIQRGWTKYGNIAAAAGIPLPAPAAAWRPPPGPSGRRHGRAPRWSWWPTRAPGHGKAGKVVGKVDHLLHAAGVEHEIVLSESGADLEARVRARGDRRSARGRVHRRRRHRGPGRERPARDRTRPSRSSRRARPTTSPASIGLQEPRVGGPRASPRGTRPGSTPASSAREERTRHFVAIASCGFDSEVNEAANAMTVRLGGTGTYVAALVKTLSRFTPGRVHDRSRRRGRRGPAHAGRGRQLDQLRGRDEGHARMPRSSTGCSMSACSRALSQARLPARVPAGLPGHARDPPGRADGSRAADPHRGRSPRDGLRRRGAGRARPRPPSRWRPGRCPVFVGPNAKAVR